MVAAHRDTNGHPRFPDRQPVIGLHQPGGLLSRTWPSGTSALWMMVLLLGLLLSGYLA